MEKRDMYAKQKWENLPSEETPVSAERLDHIESGIKTAMDNRALKEIYDDYSINLGRKSGSAVGNFSTAEGYDTTASGERSHAEGYGTTASGSYSHAEGEYTLAAGSYCHAEGNYTTAGENPNTYAAHSEGSNTVANGSYSHAEGEYTIASGRWQHVQGKYNVNDTSNRYAHIVGGGSSDSDRKNIHTIDWNGNAEFSGNVQITYNSRNISLYGVQMEMESRFNQLANGIAIAKVFPVKEELDEWLAVEGNPETLKVGQNIYIVEAGTPDYWWDGTGLQILETDKVEIESMAYDETMEILNATE